MRCGNQFKAYRRRFSQGEVCFYGRTHDTVANNFAINNFEIYRWAQTYGRLHESYAL